MSDNASVLVCEAMALLRRVEAHAHERGLASAPPVARPRIEAVWLVLWSIEAGLKAGALGPASAFELAEVGLDSAARLMAEVQAQPTRLPAVLWQTERSGGQGAVALQA